jgi:threonine dehydratase
MTAIERQPVGPRGGPAVARWSETIAGEREMDSEITRERIAATEKLIRPHIRRAPVIEVDAADFGLGASSICLKLELMQHSGSFKVRGAFANLLMRKVPPVGVIAASGGNHGVAVAFAAMRLGVKAAIFVPKVTSSAKLDRIRAYGGELVVTGEVYADALAASEARVAETGGLAVHAYDQRETLLGQGSVGLEFEADRPEIDTLLVATGGGGLIGGIAAWYTGRIQVISVEPELAPTLHDALKAGHPIDAPAGGMAADSLAPRRVGSLMFPIAQHHVAQAVLVEDEAIRDAQRRLWDVLRIASEPGGAAALAALLSGRYRPAKDERVAVLLCGANTTAVDFDR